MNFTQFSALCEECLISREMVEQVYNESPSEPWSADSIEYMDQERMQDSGNFLDAIFFEDGELSLKEISNRINEQRQILIDKKLTGSIWSTIGNIRVSVARVAADVFRTNAALLPEPPMLNPEEIRTSGNPSPYGDIQFPNIVPKPDGGFALEGQHRADYEAAGMMYDGDFLALLMARQYKIEEYMP